MSACWKDATLSDKLAKIECEAYTGAQEKMLTNIIHIAMRCVENDPDLRPEISDVNDFIKLSSNLSFKTSHMSPILESSSQLTAEMTDPMGSMPSIEITREMNQDVLR